MEGQETLEGRARQHFKCGFCAIPTPMSVVTEFSWCGVAAGVIAGCAYKFPRTTGVLVGTGLAALAAGAAFTTYELNRLAGDSYRIAEAATYLDEIQGNDHMSYD